MKDKKTCKICKYSFIHSVGVLVYVFLVTIFMTNGDKIFDGINEMIAGTIILLMFILSAVITGSLVLGKPVMLYIDGKKKESVLMLVSTTGWILLWFVVIIVINLVI